MGGRTRDHLQQSNSQSSVTCSIQLLERPHMGSKINKQANKMNQRTIWLLGSAVLLLTSGCANSVTPTPIQADSSTASSPKPAPIEPTAGLQFEDEDSPALERLLQ